MFLAFISLLLLLRRDLRKRRLQHNYEMNWGTGLGHVLTLNKSRPVPHPMTHEEPHFPTQRSLLLQLTFFVWILGYIRATHIL